MGVTFLPFVRGPRAVAGVQQAPSAQKDDLKAPKVANIGKPVVTSNITQITELLKNNEVQLDALEHVLMDFSYTKGFRPSQTDNQIFLALQGVDVNAARFPNVTRWLAHIQSFTPRQRLEWE